MWFRLCRQRKWATDFVLSHASLKSEDQNWKTAFRLLYQTRQNWTRLHGTQTTAKLDRCSRMAGNDEFALCLEREQAGGGSNIRAFRFPPFSSAEPLSLTEEISCLAVDHHTVVLGATSGAIQVWGVFPWTLRRTLEG